MYKAETDPYCYPGTTVLINRAELRDQASSEPGPCNDFRMKKRGSQSNRRQGTSGLILGRERFAKISAIEGIELSPAAKRRAAEFDRLGLSPEERIRRIVAVHRKG
jgi:hypothetical protein